MKIFKYILSGIVILYLIFSIYSFFHADDYNNFFWLFSMVIGGFITILSGLILVILTIAFISYLIQKIFNWFFE